MQRKFLVLIGVVWSCLALFGPKFYFCVFDVYSAPTKGTESRHVLDRQVLSAGHFSLSAQKAIDATSTLSYFPSVANQAKNVSAAGNEGIAFEAALKRLEGIVEAMESGDLPLESLLEKYEEGSRMVKICQTKLEEAELKIQKLEKTASGEFVLKPADPGPIQGKSE